MKTFYSEDITPSGIKIYRAYVMEDGKVGVSALSESKDEALEDAKQNVGQAGLSPEEFNKFIVEMGLEDK